MRDAEYPVQERGGPEGRVRQGDVLGWRLALRVVEAVDEDEAVLLVEVAGLVAHALVD